MKNINRILSWIGLILIVAGIVAGYVQSRELKNARAENDRLTKNVNVLNKNFVSYKTAYGHSAAKVEALTYTVKELKAYEPKVITVIKEANIRPKDVLSVAQIGTETTIHAVVPVIYKDSNKCFIYADKFFTVAGCFTRKDSTQIDACYRDSLTPIVSRIPYKFLFFRWGCKAVNLNIISQNENTKFTYLKYIELKP